MSDLNPYTLLHSDTPGVLLIHIKLEKNNYDQWSTAFRGSLMSKQKYDFVHGTIKKLARGSVEFEDWATMNLLIVLWIFATIDPSLIPQVPYKNEVKVLWDMLKNRFFAGNGPCVHELEKELGNFSHQGTGVVDYFGKLTTIWDELANYKRYPDCCSGK